MGGDDLLGNRRNGWSLISGQLGGEFGAGADAELPVDLREVPLNRLGADEQGVRHLAVRASGSDEGSDPFLGRRERAGCCGRPSPDPPQLGPSPLGPQPRAELSNTASACVSDSLADTFLRDSGVAASRAREACARARTARGGVRGARARGRGSRRRRRSSPVAALSSARQRLAIVSAHTPPVARACSSNSARSAAASSCSPSASRVSIASPWKRNSAGSPNPASATARGSGPRKRWASRASPSESSRNPRIASISKWAGTTPTASASGSPSSVAARVSATRPRCASTSALVDSANGRWSSWAVCTAASKDSSA